MVALARGSMPIKAIVGLVVAIGALVCLWLTYVVIPGPSELPPLRPLQEPHCGNQCAGGYDPTTPTNPGDSTIDVRNN